MSTERGLSVDRVREMLSYDPDTGIIVWAKSPARNVYAGEPAGCLKATRKDKNGKAVSYSYIRLDGNNIPAARIAWTLHHGEWPTGRILFEDNNPLNLKANNLAVSNSLKENSGDLDHSDRAERLKYYKDHRTKYSLEYKNNQLLDRFGISINEYSKMYMEQNGRCAICGGTDAGTRNGNAKAFAVDHDHKTGRVRGLLCEACNTGIGKLKDDPEVLRSAIRYLEKSRNAADQTDRADAVQTDRLTLAQEE
ncbi:MAG: endonuclease VII domain-containing protein [Bryobacteraceae bacterium]